MLHKLNLDDILFLDIETVPLHQQYSELSAEAQMLWEEKTRYQRKEEFSAEEFYDRAGIWAEFGKIVCISVGYFSFRHQQRTFNGKEFDFPYISRRMIINGIEIPQKLQLFGKKPWEIPHLDTMEMWKFGDYKHYTSLKLLAHILGIPSPKDDIDGSEVRNVFYNEGDIDRIATYCEKDTITVAQILLRFRNDTLLDDDEILILGR